MAQHLSLSAILQIAVLNSHFLLPARLEYSRKKKIRENLLKVNDALWTCKLWLQYVSALNFRNNGYVLLIQSDELFSSQNGSSLSLIHCEQTSRLVHDIGVFPWKNRLALPCAKTHKIHVIQSDGKLLFSFGQKGSNFGEFNLPMSVAITHDDAIVVSDTWNHRIQIFSSTGKFLQSFSSCGYVSDIITSSLSGPFFYLLFCI